MVRPIHLCMPRKKGGRGLQSQNNSKRKTGKSKKSTLKSKFVDFYKQKNLLFSWKKINFARIGAENGKKWGKTQRTSKSAIKNGNQAEGYNQKT